MNTIHCNGRLSRATMSDTYALRGQELPMLSIPTKVTPESLLGIALKLLSASLEEVGAYYGTSTRTDTLWHH